MATSAVWKLESDNNFATNCFPARGIVRKANEGSGSWIVAYAEAQHNKFKASFKPEKQVQIQEQIGNATPSATVTLDGVKQGPSQSGTLDGKFLLWRHHVESPLDLCSINVSDRELDNVNEEDFKEFVNVAYLNAAENLLPFRPFTNFPNLRELELPVNGLRNLKVNPGDFPNLQVLDLSYNNLSAQDVLDLGVLPRLKVLTLTGNGLHSIHPDMARPFIIAKENSSNDSTNSADEYVIGRFQNLEVLLLDDNHLSDLSTFASLAALTQLKELNLDKNNIQVIPHLRVVGDRVLSEVHSSVGQAKSTASKSSGRKSRNSRRTASASKPPTTDLTQDKRNMATSTTFLQEQNEQPESHVSLNTPDVSVLPSTPNPPFQHLRLLSIANNNLAEEECVLAVASWPRLKHLILNGNPIVKTTSGEPPLISHYLHKRLGISIHRSEKKLTPSKPHILMPTDKERKVSSFVPKIPKQPVDVLLNSLTAPKPNLIPRPPSQPKPLTKEFVKLPSIPQQQDTSAQEESVFLTQVDEIPDEQTQQKPKRQVQKKNTKVNEKQEENVFDLNNYEILMDARPDSSLHEPIGIQGNVRALHHLLSHQTVFRTSDVTLDRVLPCYKAKSTRHSKAMAVARERGKIKLPTKKEQLAIALSDIRNRDVAATEVPLTDALYMSSDVISQDEADDLLRDVEEKYRVVREESLRASRQAQRAFQEAKDAVQSLQE
ncbi:X-ray radiation resistance-associated protein 1 [Ciona intestinalis]